MGMRTEVGVRDALKIESERTLQCMTKTASSKRILTRANAGNVEAQEILIDRNYFGNRVPINITFAENWASKAAEKGPAQGMAFLGHCSYKGIGVRRDMSKAHYWCRKAARAGYGHAQAWLGYAYEKGLGVKCNLKTAIEWYRRAAQN